MSIFSNPLAGQVFGSIAGGLFGGGAAKRLRGNVNDANMMKIMPYLDMRDQLLGIYNDADASYNAAKDAGFYQGKTRADMDPRTKAGLDAGYGFGQTAAGDASGFMDTARSFGQNSSDLYNRASQDMLGTATQYALDNVEPLLTTAMRDSRRQLEEQALPGVSQGAMGTGNTNSSRAGMREAILERGYGDRESDMRSSLMDRLTDRSLGAQQNQLANMTAANQNLAALYDMGFGLGGKGAAAMTGAGAAYQADEQGRLDDARMREEGARDYGLNLAGSYANILRSAYPGGASFGSIAANTTDPYMAALSGGQFGGGFFGDMFGGGGGYSGGFNPGFSGYYGSDGGGIFSMNAPTTASGGYY